MNQVRTVERTETTPNRIRTVTYYDGKRQQGVSTLLLRKSLEYSQDNRSVLIVAANETMQEAIEQRLEGLLGPLPKTHNVIHHDPSDEELGNVEAVFVDDYIHGPIVNMQWFIARNPTVDFHLGASHDD